MQSHETYSFVVIAIPAIDCTRCMLHCNQLNVPGVPRVCDIVLAPDTRALVMEHVPGVPLVDLIPLSLRHFLTVARQTTEVLGRIHAAGVIHNNIQPASIWYDIEGGTVHILNFDSAVVFDTDANSTAPRQQANSVKGASSAFDDAITNSANDSEVPSNLHYCSPEQTGKLANAVIDYRSDLYSLGATLFELLTTVLPYDSQADALPSQISMFVTFVY
jgi:histidine kinase